MKYLKKATSAILALCMTFALCVSASAMKVFRPDEQRLLEGKYFLGYDDNRLSEICECSPGSVRMKLTRARRKILNIMEREVEMHDKA